LGGSRVFIAKNEIVEQMAATRAIILQVQPNPTGDPSAMDKVDIDKFFVYLYQGGWREPVANTQHLLKIRSSYSR
jgi:hypothetical protein